MVRVSVPVDTTVSLTGKYRLVTRNQSDENDELKGLPPHAPQGEPWNDRVLASAKGTRSPNDYLLASPNGIRGHND